MWLFIWPPYSNESSYNSGTMFLPFRFLLGPVRYHWRLYICVFIYENPINCEQVWNDSLCIEMEHGNKFDITYYIKSIYFLSVIGTSTENTTINSDVSSNSPSSQAPTVSIVNFNIHLKRLPMYYLLSIIIPTVVLLILSTFTFYVPIDSGEKLSVAITILLSFTVFMWILLDKTPQVSQNLPFLGNSIIISAYDNELYLSNDFDPILFRNFHLHTYCFV